MAAEFEVHLLDSVEALEREGLSGEEAERVALDRFGSPAAVARALANSRGVGVPTQLTRFGGVALALGAVAVATTDVMHDHRRERRRIHRADASSRVALTAAAGSEQRGRSEPLSHDGLWTKRDTPQSGGFVQTKRPPDPSRVSAK